MYSVRRGAERGHADHGWLNTSHTFSFASYYDPQHMGFRSLRVMNEDRVSPGAGFGEHAHHDMEIVSYVLSGALEHKDSMGNGETLTPGEFQRITAGSGIRHSEFNPSATEPTHFYQVWLTPEREGLPPGYEQKAFDRSARRGKWQLVASREGADGSLTIHQDATILLADLTAGEQIAHLIDAGRHAWLQVLRGGVSAGDVGAGGAGAGGAELAASDGLAVSDEASIEITATSYAELMLFDLA